jgi:DMSO/TMAO reductase YedYZ molybdopterin-dependent catalytic subunit
MKRSLEAVGSWSDARVAEPGRSDRVAAILGSLLGISFLVCFVTGLISHLVQHPVSGFSWFTRPAGLYRFTQGLHIATGIASVPLLFAKLWSVFPRLFRWPFADDAIHAVERLSLLPLVGGSLFMLVTGVANIELWYPWVFFFPAAHYAMAFVTMGAMVIHLASKWATVRRELRRTVAADEVVDTVGRRRFLGTVGAMSAALVAATVGQTVWPLRKLSLLAPRRPDIGTQGFPVNKTGLEAGVVDSARDANFSLVVEMDGRALRTFSLAELRSIPERSATLPIACVEGWSTNQSWTGVSVRDVLEAAGAPLNRDLSVESLQAGGRYRRSTLTSGQLADRDSLLAMKVGGEDLHVDHGFPLRLIAPNRPGVLQTKWVNKLVVL